MKWAVIPFAGEIHVDLPDDFTGTPSQAYRWAMDNLPRDFTIDSHIRTSGGQWDFYEHISQGNVWWAETTAEVTIEDDDS